MSADPSTERRDGDDDDDDDDVRLAETWASVKTGRWNRTGVAEKPRDTY